MRSPITITITITITGSIWKDYYYYYGILRSLLLLLLLLLRKSFITITITISNSLTTLVQKHQGFGEGCHWSFAMPNPFVLTNI